MQRIDDMVTAMLAAYPVSSEILALSYDPTEKEQGMTALQSEWELLKRHVKTETPDKNIPR